MSSSSEARPAPRPDLRSGVWTRLGDGSVLGDRVTEVALGALAERAGNAARAQGYAVGWAEGRREAVARAAETAAEVAAAQQVAEQRRAAAHADAVVALVAAADGLRAAAQQVCEQVADQATGLAFDVVRELLGRELALAADPGADVVRRVVAALPAGEVARVRLHPGAVEGATAPLAERGVRVVADPALAVGDAVVETDDAAVDLRLTAALERLREVLR